MDPKIKGILEALGWEEIVSKNEKMYSFLKEDMRLNYYFTTGTTTIQNQKGRIQTYRDVLDDCKMEEIICNYEN